MRRLRNLSDIDKHRTIVPTVAFPHTARLEVKLEGATIVSQTPLINSVTELKTGTKILRLIAAKVGPPNIEIGMEGQVQFVLVLPRSVAQPFRTELAVFPLLVLHQISATCADLVAEIEGDK